MALAAVIVIAVIAVIAVLATVKKNLTLKTVHHIQMNGFGISHLAAIQITLIR